MANEITPGHRRGGAPKGSRGSGAATGRRANWRAWAAALAWYVVAVLVLAVPVTIHPTYPTQAGERARGDIKAPYEFTVVDEDATQKERTRITELLDHVWVLDEGAASRDQQRLQSFISLLHDENPTTNEKLRRFVQDLSEQFAIEIEPSTANQFQANHLRNLHPPLSLDKDVRERLSQSLSTLLGNHVIIYDNVAFQAHLGGGRLKVANTRGTALPVPRPSEVLTWPEGVTAYLNTEMARYFPNPDEAELRRAGVDLLAAILRPKGANLVYDRERFEREREEAYARLKTDPVQKHYKTDEMIVKDGETLSPLQAEALARLNEMMRNNRAIQVGGIMLLTAIFFAAIGFYMARFRREMVFTASTVTLHVLPPLMAVAIGQAITYLGHSGENTVLLWFPAAMVGLLTSILITPQVAFVLTLAAACLFGVVTDQPLRFIVYALFSGFGAVFASRRVRARGEVLWVGVQVGIVNIVTLAILDLLKKMTLPPPGSVVAALLSGIACAFGTLVLLVLFERMFGVITDLRLLELTGLRNPLIAQFEEKAPGSYQHVLNVVKLAEAAAQAIGANYLLVRAGAYFHDIGKMIKPKYFSENQVTLEDKKAHSRLAPYMSVLIIKNHVKEGVKLARDFRLPEKVTDFIPQHHGSGLIRYFYTEAMKRYTESGATDEPREEDFRYPGPKPQSIEAAIVMLADSVEAVASSKFTGGQVAEGELRKLVQTTITDKFDDGQFDECDLTMRHLHLIRESFVKTLMGRFHFRVAYPTLPPRPPAAVREAREPAIAIAGPVGPA